MSKSHRAHRNGGGCNRHHTVPRSRNGGNGGDNVIVIPKIDHDKYHALFGNMTPDEAMAHIYYNYTTEAWRKEHQEIEG